MQKSIYALAVISTLIAFTFSTQTASAQQQAYLPKLEVQEKKTYVVGPENILRVDTLVMHDKATIKFSPGRDGILEAKVAIIGSNCVIISRGANGINGKDLNPGGDGEHGGNLDLAIHFDSLGKLTIDTRGGNGGAGANGRNGKPGTQDKTETRTVTDSSGKKQTITVTVPGQAGTNGTDATDGGNSGNGGNVRLMYSANNFIPIFNQDKRKTNSIIILNTAGRRGATGKPGKGGYRSVNGVVLYSETTKSQNGQVELINAKPAVN
ncbi:hypothetical protein [Pontibacter ruber]|uniref:Collagen-like protein n=1 Tax=Pontibacter ruber TaxID=1343895 RepID=A0ABW5CV05_9BACT|nr:hypothetical protein [Pontibacter ruber]